MSSSKMVFADAGGESATMTSPRKRGRAARVVHDIFIKRFICFLLIAAGCGDLAACVVVSQQRPCQGAQNETAMGSPIRRCHLRGMTQKNSGKCPNSRRKGA